MLVSTSRQYSFSSTAARRRSAASPGPAAAAWSACSTGCPRRYPAVKDSAYRRYSRALYLPPSSNGTPSWRRCTDCRFVENRPGLMWAPRSVVDSTFTDRGPRPCGGTTFTIPYRSYFPRIDRT